MHRFQCNLWLVLPIMCNSRFPINFWMQIEECWYWIHPSVRSLIWRLFDHQILVIWTLHTQFFLFPIFCFVMDRPFNLKGGGGVMGFCFVQNFFFGQHKSSNIYLFCRAKREIFLKNSTSGYMTKTLNQIIVFCLHQNQNIFFQQHWESEYFFRKKP